MSANIRQPVEHLVYTRAVDPLTGPKVNGEITGWVLDPNLRCRHVVHRAGPGIGRARLDYISLNQRPPAIEDVLAAYHPDTQVRVELFGYDSPQGADTGDEQTGLVVFEGVMERLSAQVQAAGTRSRESASMIAVALPWIDGRAVAHQVTGRWMHFFLTDTWDRIESPTLPAAFNHRGRGNMDADDTHTKAAAGLPDGVTLTAQPFTHDDDTDGTPWTVGEAIKSILVQWLYGEAPNPRNRVTGVEPDTLAALEAYSGAATGSIPDERFKGLSDILPETDVSGMPVFTAIRAVCRAGGFEFAVEPVQAAADGDTAASDRRYTLRLWRRHSGPAVDLMLPKRGQFPATAAETLKRANTQKLTVLRDNAGVVNHVFARGRVLIEAAVVLRPLWKPADMATTLVTSLHQLPAADVDDTYHHRHVQGGGDYAAYGHVGRGWGVDCTGAASVAEAFYITDPYQHAPSGFDWLGALGIDGDDPLTAERTARHIDAATDPIVWTNRLRRPLPLRRADALDTGRRYVIEVSEDAGETWADVTDRLTFTTLRDFFGIQFNNVPNLAAVSAATLGTDRVPVVADSWWQKIFDADLSFRLTCLVEADHAALYRAARQDTSGTAYERGEVIALDIDEVWSHTDSVLNTSGGWEKIPAAPGSAADRTADLRGAAERYRDAREGTRYSVTSDDFTLDALRWRVGDRVRGVAGRGISFATNAGAEARHPSIHGVRLVLSPGKAQGVFLSLNDTKLRRGV